MTTVAVAQLASVPHDAAATAEKAVDAIAEARERGAELILFPEAFLGGYPKGLSFGSPVGTRTPQGRAEYTRYAEAAVDLDGPELARVAEAAREHGVFVVIGIIERHGRTLYCTVVMIGEDGERRGIHRKLMPTGAERLIWGFGDGSTLPVLPSPAGAVGAVICWENYMPLLRAAMYGQGIQIYCAPTADDRETWLPTVRHIALEGRCFVLSACQAIRRRDYPDDYDSVIDFAPDDFVLRGGSVIISPRGEILAGPLVDAEGLLVAEVDLGIITAQSLDFDAVGHYARPDIFSLTVDTRAKHPVSFTSA